MRLWRSSVINMQHSVLWYRKEQQTSNIESSMINEHWMVMGSGKLHWKDSKRSTLIFINRLVLHAAFACKANAQLMGIPAWKSQKHIQRLRKPYLYKSDTPAKSRYKYKLYHINFIIELSFNILKRWKVVSCSISFISTKVKNKIT